METKSKPHLLRGETDVELTQAGEMWEVGAHYISQLLHEQDLHWGAVTQPLLWT